MAIRTCCGPEAAVQSGGNQPVSVRPAKLPRVVGAASGGANASNPLGSAMPGCAASSCLSALSWTSVVPFLVLTLTWAALASNSVNFSRLIG